MEKPSLNANLIKKYHQDIVYNYAEYPTCDHWNYDFKSEDYKKSLVDWLPKNKDKPIFFYVHIPFCEQLCWFCTCSKFITNDYEEIKGYLKYLYMENFAAIPTCFDTCAMELRILIVSINK